MLVTLFSYITFSLIRGGHAHNMHGVGVAHDMVPTHTGVHSE